jgi:hypothetical protein
MIKNDRRPIRILDQISKELQGIGGRMTGSNVVTNSDTLAFGIKSGALLASTFTTITEKGLNVL